MPRVTIDGQTLETAEDRPVTILDAAGVLGIDVPTICHDPRLVPSGACRLCVVAVDEQPHPVPACTTVVRQGMVVRTRTDELVSLRRTLLRMLAEQHPAAAVATDPEQPFHRLLRAHGIETSPPVGEDPVLVDDSHPTIRVDLARCISCWRCVCICDEVQGQFVWRIQGRGVESRIAPDSGTTLAASSCVACGACVDTCPTGALADRSVIEWGAPTTWTRTTCPYCGVGCELLVGARDGRITGVRPALDAPVNQGHLCVKGRAGFGFVTASDRVGQPMIRRDGDWQSASWEEAIGIVADRLQAIRARHGPDAIGMLGSARATNEDNYLVQKLARAVIGTNNTDCCARVCHAPSATALRTMLGTGAATNSFVDIEAARTILVCGANATENHPVVGARIKQAALSGTGLVVIDPRRIELARYADVHLQPRPGTNVLVLNAMAATIIEEDLVDRDFLAARVDGLDEMGELVRTARPEDVAVACGVDAGEIRDAARRYATATPAMAFHGLGLTEHRQGTEGVMALVNLALLTGNLGRPGAGVNPLRGQNNVQGAAHMGCEPAHLAGYAPVAENAERVGAVWGTSVPTTPGLDAVEMLAAATDGALHALWVVGWDLLDTQPNAHATRRALASLDLLVVQDLFLNETARELASVFLPVASAFEKGGTFMNAERRVQRVRPALDPPAGVKPDWEVLCLAARAMGHGHLFEFASPESVWEEIRQVWPAGAGMTYARLEAPGGLQWPCPDVQHPGTTQLHVESFPGLGPRTALRRLEHVPGDEHPTPELPLVLVTGRSLYQFNAGTMTRRSATQALRPTDLLELSPTDADALGLAAGDVARVTSRYGEARLPVQVTDSAPSGVVFATFQDPETSVNRVTSPHRDPYTNTPEYKVTAVRVEPA